MWTSVVLILGITSFLVGSVHSDTREKRETGRAAASNPSGENAKKRLSACREVYEGIILRDKLGGEGRFLDIERLYQWSRRWMEAQHDLSKNKEERIGAVQAHLKRMQALETTANNALQEKQIARYEAAAATFFRLEAEELLAAAKKK